jgi:hypothetical protein
VGNGKRAFVIGAGSLGHDSSLLRFCFVVYVFENAIPAAFVCVE